MVPGGREKYYTALFERLKALVKVKSYWRCTPIGDVPSDHQTAIVMHVADQMTTNTPRMPGVHDLGAVVEVLARPKTTNPRRPGDAILNDVIDQIEAAMERQEGEPIGPNGETWFTTLGGIVQRCWINDHVVFVSTGEASDQAVALVPVVMEVVGGRKQAK